VTLVEFVLARLADVEFDALAACQGDGYRDWDVPSTGVVQVAGGDLDGLALAPRNAALHMARHDPDRVLRRVAADRQIVDDCMASINDAGTGPGEYGLALSTLRSLALPYADHEDYRQGWRP
jgi:hypothetical protein